MPQTKKVFIYSTPTCHFCHMAKEFFAAHGIAFTDYDVASDLEKRQELKQKSGQMGVPVIRIVDESIPEGGEGREEIVIGFDEDLLSRSLGVTA